MSKQLTDSDFADAPVEPASGRVTRRRFLKSVSTGVATGVASASADGFALGSPDPAQNPVTPGSAKRLKGTIRVKLNVNGQAHDVDVEPRTTLLNVLRDHLDLTGAKKICDRGSCGGCTVIADGRNIYSCMMLAADAQHHAITTVEGLGDPGKMHPVQAAFVEQDALMCGFCTPGFVVTCANLLAHNPNPTLDDVRRACAGNLCRCGTYPRVFEAALAAAKSMKGGA